jgi:phasin family protein
MADAIITNTDDGQSIPSALAATPASKKSRSKAPKTAKVEFQPEHPLATLVEAEAVIEAEAPHTQIEAEAPQPEVEAEAIPETPVIAAPEPEPVAEVAPAPIAVPLSTPTAAVPADRKKESIMATTIDNVTNQTAKAQAFFADANVRTKDAVAKSAKLFEEAGAFGKGNVEALVESSKIAAKGLETLGQDAAEFGRKQFEEATAAFKTLATVKSPTEFLKLQSDFVRSTFDALVAETSRSTETVLKLAGEVAQPISNRFAVAAEKMKTAA